MSRGFLDEDGAGMKRNQLVELDLDVVRSTEKALLLTDGKTEAWVPRSQCSVAPEAVSMPQWLAEDRGWA